MLCAATADSGLELAPSDVTGGALQRFVPVAESRRSLESLKPGSDAFSLSLITELEEG